MSNNGYYIVRTDDYAVYDVFESKEDALEFIYAFLDELEDEDEDSKDEISDSGIISTKS